MGASGDLGVTSLNERPRTPAHLQGAVQLVGCLGREAESEVQGGGSLHRLKQARRLTEGEKRIIIVGKAGASISSARARHFGGPSSSTLPCSRR